MTQVKTPWIAPLNNEPYQCVWNFSPFDNENCGGRDPPCFPFQSTNGADPMHDVLSFHMAMATIPTNKPFIWIPDEWHSEQYMTIIALCIMCLALVAL